MKYLLKALTHKKKLIAFLDLNYTYTKNEEMVTEKGKTHTLYLNLSRVGVQSTYYLHPSQKTLI